MVSRLNDPRVKIVISHSTTDEGATYEQRIRSYARHMKVDLIIRPDIIGDRRGRTRSGSKIYTLWDVYPHADLVSYPSIYEGFGNAFIEAIYFRKPIVVNRYSAYVLDIEPYGFQAIEMDGYVTDEVLDKIRLLMNDPSSTREIAEKNYRLAARFFSYEVLRRKLRSLLVNFEGIVEAIESQEQELI
jgi:glycosyltransferase involved in cell wall biosynthesis